MRTREELGLSDHRYRSLVEQVPAVSYVARWEPGSPFSYVSPQIEQLLGFPAERWVAEPDLWAERLHPADRELVLMEEMRTFQHEIEYDREYRMIAADGSVKWVWERDAIVRDDDGRPIQTEGVIVDITERKLAEARAQHYLDVAGTILLVLRTDQTVELLNRHGRELLGYEDGELLGKDWYDAVVPEDDRQARRDNFIRDLAGGERAVHLPPGRRHHADRRAPHDRLAQHAAARHRGRGHRASSPRARTSPSACARRRRSPASPTSTR